MDDHEDWEGDHNWGTAVGGILVIVILLSVLITLLQHL